VPVPASQDGAGTDDAYAAALAVGTAWRGDHTALIGAIAGQLSGPVQVAAEAATVLGSAHRIAGQARQALAEQVGHERCDLHDGPQLWAAEDPRLRRAHQEAYDQYRPRPESRHRRIRTRRIRT
jgi:hypothetical protein